MDRDTFHQRHAAVQPDDRGRGRVTDVVAKRKLGSGDRSIRARIVLNPRAGNADDVSDVLAAQRLWQAHGWHVDTVATEYAGHAIELAREAAAAEYDLVVAAGGDGTVNEVVNGI